MEPSPLYSILLVVELHKPISYVSSLDYANSQQVIIPLPMEAQNYAVQLGWWQLAERQTGVFAVDDILLGPSTYSYGST